jgi:hypothetical protein
MPLSRSGYSDECEPWALICWRGAVKAAITGSRGQQLLRDMRDALDAMPVKRLIRGDLQNMGGDVCALGAVAKAKGIAVDAVDPYDREGVAKMFNIAPALAAEIAYENDEDFRYWREETDERRWERMRAWVESNLAKPDSRE